MPALRVIIPFDTRCCSINCEFNRTYTGKCTVRGATPDLAETIARDGDFYLRTRYCIEKASIVNEPSRKVTYLPTGE